MKFPRVIPVVLVTLAVFPCSAFAQTPRSDQPAADRSRDVVSVRDLSIPNQARRAFNKGIERLKAGDWSAGVQQFQRAIRLFPGFYEAYDMIGAANVAMQRWDLAEAAYRESIELSHHAYAPPYFGLGMALCNARKQCADAEALINYGLSLDPSNASGHYAMAWVLCSAGRFGDAERSAREAVVHAPGFADTFLLLAQIHLRQNKPSAAVEDWEDYLKLDPYGSRSDAVRAARDRTLRLLANQTSASAALP